MPKFYEIIKDECNFQYDMYLIESKDVEKKVLLSRFVAAYTLQEKCVGKGDFDIVIEYLKLKSDMKRELDRIIEICGKNDSSAVDWINKIEELNRIGFFLRRA